MKSQKIIDLIKQSISNEWNVLLIGEAGVGKTKMAQKAIEEAGVHAAYFSGAGMDPITDVIGIPVVGPDGNVRYCRSDVIKEAEVLFVDEANRIHPRVASALFEIMVSRTICGEPCNVRSVIGAVNPMTDEYHVEEMDRALRDRFHVIIEIPYEIPEDYFASKYGEDIAAEVASWWNSLGTEVRAAIPPRRLEVIIDAMLETDIDPEYFAPVDDKLRRIPVPFSRLREIVKKKNLPLDLVRDQEQIRAQLRQDIDIMPKLIEAAARVSWATLPPKKVAEVYDIIAELPGDIIRSISAAMTAEKMNKVHTELSRTLPPEEFAKIVKKINEKVGG